MLSRRRERQTEREKDRDRETEIQTQREYSLHHNILDAKTETRYEICVSQLENYISQ